MMINHKINKMERKRKALQRKSNYYYYSFWIVLIATIATMQPVIIGCGLLVAMELASKSVAYAQKAAEYELD